MTAKKPAAKTKPVASVGPATPFNPYRSMPKTVKVGCYTFNVVLIKAGDPDNYDRYGDMAGGILRIRLAPNQPPEQLANTFIHEVLHAINYFVGTHDKSTEEEFTTQGANGLCMFAQMNPSAMTWWLKVNGMGNPE